MGCGATVNAENFLEDVPHEVKIQNKTPSAGASQLLKPQLKLILSMIQRNEWKKAIGPLQEYIKNQFDKNLEIDGLGNYQVALGYYECFPYNFYMEGINEGKFKGTAIDLLNLTYMVLRLDDQVLWQGLQFYKKMNQQFQDCWQLLFGYAIVISNQGYYDEAVEYYRKAIDLKPDFAPCYENICYVYEYKRIQASKAVEWAKKALTVDPNSMYAQFSIAKNQKDTEERILKVKEVTQKFPKYARAINYVGFVYGEMKKMPQEAIVWHKKAVSAIPFFDIGNYNIGMRYEALKDYKNAIHYYLQGNLFDKDYRLPCNKLVPIFIDLKYTDEQIEEEVRKHNGPIDYIFYNIGKSYYDLNHDEQSLKYYRKAEAQAKQLKKELQRLYNSMANTYLHMKKYNESIQYFNKGIALNPNLDMLYYNLANVYKELGKVQQAKKYHKKCIQVNPRYSYPYNNLANIYVDERNYDQAIKNFKNAIKNRSNYVLAMANLGVTYLKVQNYRDAFNAIARAKELLQANKKDLSPGNIVFLTQTLEKFDKEGQMWRKSGGITEEMRKKLQSLIKSFESNFSRLYTEGKQKMNIQKILKKQVLEIVKLIADANFQMNPIDSIYELVKKIFEDNQEYFHIVPLLFIEYFYQSVLIKKRPILDVENQLFTITKRLSAKTLQMTSSNKKDTHKKNKLKDFKLTHFDPPTNCKVNLFKNAAFFGDYAEIYNEILQVNNQASECYSEYKSMVDKVRIESKGILYGIGMKIPKLQQEQFKVILRIFQKMFKKQLTTEKVNKIINSIEKELEKENLNKKLTLPDVVHVIMNNWTSQITSIVKQRKKNSIETSFEISDLLRAKIMFENTDNLKKALTLIDQACFKLGYKIIELENRLEKQQTQDVVLKIQIRDTVCELQLAMEQDQSQYHFIHSIYEIERSPLGCIFGSYIYMSKGFNYPLVQNCKDIVENLKNSQVEEEKKALEAAKFIVANSFL